MIINILVITWCMFSVFLDIKYKKISNYISYLLIFISIITNMFLFSYSGFLESALGVTIGMISCIIPYKLRSCDFGEFKILGLIGAIAGYKFAVLTCIISCIFIILMYILHLIISKELKSFFLNADTYFQLIMEYDVDISVIIEEHLNILYVPYSVIILLSVLLLIIV